jgi:23S rRNA pseudouridine2605 synthase
MNPKRNTRPGKSSAGHGSARPRKSGASARPSPSARASSKNSQSNQKTDQPNGSPGQPARKGGLGKRKTDNFNKFYNKKRNSAVKEAFRQEKKAAKKERKEAIERHFEERRLSRGGQNQQTGPAQRQHSSNPHYPKTTHHPKTSGLHDPQSSGTHHEHIGPAKPRQSPIRPAAKGPIPFKGGAPKTPKTPMPQGSQSSQSPHFSDQLPLNKYIAHGGICSRRDAADLIRQGKVTVNGQLITEPGTKVAPTDLVKINGKKITISRNFVYILLNKPKDYITTTDDPQGRKTVLDLIRPATTERVFPVGRLDRNTSGVLLLTNDGDLAQKLAHPSHQIKKIYHVTLDKPLTRADFDKIINGDVQLDDGPAEVDVMAYADPKDKTQIGLEIHSGRNRIVRRIFEHLGYDVRGLDRVMYAGLTKKNVQRGHWRLLSEKEIRILKYLNSSIKGSPGRAKDLAPATIPTAIIPDTKEQRGTVAPHSEQPTFKTPAAKDPAPKAPFRKDLSIAPRAKDQSKAPRAEHSSIAPRAKDSFKAARAKDPRSAPGIRPASRRPGKPRRPSAPRLPGQATHEKPE